MSVLETVRHSMLKEPTLTIVNGLGAQGGARFSDEELEVVRNDASGAHDFEGLRAVPLGLMIAPR